jgi:Zn-dependent protease with chaperone function
MRRTPNLILALLCATMLPLTAQLQPVFSFQKDDTILRKSYYDQTVKKKDQSIASADKQYEKDYKEIYEDQFKEIAGLWKSTRPITSTEAHSYLQSIVQKIVGANPELKGTDARIVFSRDWWPNAVSMGDGSIAINAGLLIYMDNEAELVFAICHELSHYYLEHTPKAIKKYVETVNSEAFKAEVKRLSKEEYRVNQQMEALAKSIVFNTRRHSRDNEAAADRQAFIFMKKTGYDLGAIKTTLEMLDRVDDTLLFNPLDLPQVFNFPDYPFKKKWIQKESAIFSKVEDNSSLTPKEGDSLKTHPDCNKRIALLQDSIQSAGQAGRKFLVNEALFKQLKKDFFIEIIEQCYRDKNISRALYYSLQLLQAKENTPVAIYTIARCLNLVYENQKNHTLGSMIGTETRGNLEEYNLLLRMLNRLRLDEIASLSYWFCNQQLPLMKTYSAFETEMSKAKSSKEQSAL